MSQQRGRRPQAPCLTVEPLADGALRVAGEIDASNSASLAQALRRAVDGPGDLRLDLSALRFIDAGGARTLRGAAAELNRRGARLRLCSAQPPVRRLISLIGLDREVSLILEEAPS